MREYVGTGLIGELAAAEDAERRAERTERRDAWNAEKQELEHIDGLLGRFTEDVSYLTRMVLVDAGYYRHHRGEWRKRRVRK